MSFCLSIYSQHDMAGSKDHPAVTRYPDSKIVYYEEQEYTTYSIATGAIKGYKSIEDWVDIEGKFTRIYYELSGKQTITQLYRNYEKAFNRAGFEIIAKGVYNKSNRAKDVGGRPWLGVFYAKNPYPTGKNILMAQGSSTSGGSAFISGKQSKASGTVYITIGAVEYSSDKIVYIVDVIEETIMEDGLVTISAEEIIRGFKADGKIALYGIYFDFDKATIKPESEETFKVISSLLNKDKALNLFVVGHTDMTGGLKHNLDLSSRRADAVVNELTGRFGIEANRLTAQGVGPLAPVSTNLTDEGRKLNRRVELVVK